MVGHATDLRGYLRRQMAEANTADELLKDVFVKAMHKACLFGNFEERRDPA